MHYTITSIITFILEMWLSLFWHEALQILLGLRPNELLHHTALLHQEHSRHSTHAILDRQLCLIINVHLGQINCPLSTFHCLDNRRAQLFAWATPLRVEVHNNWFCRLHDAIFEIAQAFNIEDFSPRCRDM